MAATNIIPISRRFLTRKEAAEYLGVSMHTIEKLCFKRKIRYYSPTGKQSYFDVGDLDKYVMSGEVVEPCVPEKIVRAGRFGKPNVKQ